MSDTPAAPRELPLLIGRGRDQAETLLLIGAPVGGRVAVRRWSGAEWGDAPDPAPSTDDALALLAWIEAQAAAGRSLTQSLYAVRLWLTGLGDRIP